MKSSTQFLAVAFVIIAACGGSSGTGPDGTGGAGGTGNSDSEQPVGGNGGASGAAGSGAGSAGASGAPGVDAGKAADATTSKRTKTGEPCTRDDQCESMVRDDGVCMKDWPGGGYCTTGPCVTTSRCMEQTSCYEYQGTSRCFKMCSGSKACRDGYTCNSNNNCVPAQ
jgi:hypothetical protein